MKVVIDTSVWSLAFRRNVPHVSGHVTLLKDLIQDGRAILLGVVRQELLSGIRHEEQFRRLRNHLRYFPEPRLETEDYETAARHHNTCMAAGIQGSTIDFLISAYASRRDFHILSTDTDFRHYAPYIPVKFFAP